MSRADEPTEADLADAAKADPESARAAAEWDEMTDDEREAALNAATQGSADDWTGWDEEWSEG